MTTTTTQNISDAIDAAFTRVADVAEAARDLATLVEAANLFDVTCDAFRARDNASRIRAGEALSAALLRVTPGGSESPSGTLPLDLRNQAAILRALRWEKDRGLDVARGQGR